jgi:hypothetical protein
VKPSDIFD